MDAFISDEDATVQNNLGKQITTLPGRNYTFFEES